MEEDVPLLLEIVDAFLRRRRNWAISTSASHALPFGCTKGEGRLATSLVPSPARRLGPKEIQQRRMLSRQQNRQSQVPFRSRMCSIFGVEEPHPGTPTSLLVAHRVASCYLEEMG